MELTRRNVLLGVIGVYALLAVPSFLEHYIYFITGQVEAAVIKQRWDFVALNVIAFLLFLIPLNYRRKADWKSMGIYSAFIVSLFIEMYGIPLTIYLSAAAIAPTASAAPGSVIEFSFFGATPEMTLWMLIGVITTVVGMAIVAVGWYTIYNARDELVTSGIYSYSRHPQYVGISLIAIGWFIGWPTILTTLLLPVLLYVYYKNSLQEEKEVSEEVGEEKYQSYMAETPRFL